MQRKQPVTLGRYGRAEPKKWSGGQPSFVCAGNRPKPACRIAPKRSDGEPSFFLFGFYEAAARDLTHPAKTGPW